MVSTAKVAFAAKVALFKMLVISVVVNSPVPPALTARIAPLAMLIFPGAVCPGKSNRFLTSRIPSLTSVLPE